ncbi:hypothetical protein ACRALDRAFT_2024394 [Sodiomyces alcalophilus JCM 7366]|uniref:uncharacterized protein n=1 Tax=Sodiomyces alcalophilus JCM 7366 TaxID=591952 RepID=UPI0039B61A2F
MAPPLLLPREGESSGITVGWLLAIALGGGALLFVSVAFILVSLTDRRNHRAQLAARALESQPAYHNLDGSSSKGVNGSSHPPTRSGHRRRLTKSPQVTPARSRSSTNTFLFPRLPSSGSLSQFFGLPKKNSMSKGVQRNNSCRTNSWVDEDAIHGPKMGNVSPRESKRISFRDSWLILRSPTLPALLGLRDDLKGESFYQHHNYPLVPQPRPIAIPPGNREPHNHGQDDESKPASRVPLGRTPSYELAEKRAATLRAGLARQDSQRTNPVPQGPRPPPAARLRQGVTESDLQEILRNTAQRLQEGSPSPSVSPTRQPTHMATRHRRTSSTRESPVKLRRLGLDGTVPVPQMPSRAAPATPSPQKMDRQPAVAPNSAPAAMYHRRFQNGSPQKVPAALTASTVQTPPGRRRNVSQSSVVSETDSLFGETIPEPEQIVDAGLSSPSRRGAQDAKDSVLPLQQAQPEQQRRRSMSVQSIASSVSSALSTVYSENESEEDSGQRNVWRNTLHPNLSGQPMQKTWSQRRRATHVVKMSDPFSAPPAAPQIPTKSPRRPMVMPRGTPPTLHSRRASSQDGQPLGSISGNSQPSPGGAPIMSSLVLSDKVDPASRDELRLSIMMSPPDMGGRGGNVRPKTVSIMKPTIFTKSSSAVSMQASPSTPEDDRRGVTRGHRPKTSSGARSAVIPPPLNLHPILGSPRTEEKNGNNTATQSWFVTSESVDGIASPSSSPTSHRPRPLPDPFRPSTEFTANHNSPSRGPSSASDSSSRHSDAQSNNSQGSSCTSAHFPKMTSKRATPPGFPPLHASIVQLRRMGSQMSTHSRASTLPPESPTLPALRGGGFSPERSDSRAGRAGRVHYLSLGGQSPPSSAGSSPGSASRTPRRGRCIKNARDSMEGPRRKIGMATGENRMAKERPAQITEEQENSRDNTEQQGHPGGGVSRRSSLKGSFRSTGSPRRRLSVRFGEVEEHVFVQDRKINSGHPEVAMTGRDREQELAGGREADRQSNMTPTKLNRQEIRESKDSLGLYDKDGFLMSSPERLPSSAAEGRPSAELRI